MTSLNLFLFSLINQQAGKWPLLDGFFVLLTTYIAWGTVIVVLLFVISYPFLTTDPLHRIRRIAAALEIVTAMFVTWVLVWYLKVMVALPRPFIAIHGLHPLVRTGAFDSFPSSHAALTMALAIAVLPYQKRLGHILILFSCIVAFSRVFVGVHYPFDIGVGLLIGYLIPKIIHRVFVK